MLTITELIILSAACWQSVEVWHHSTLFEGRRAYFEARGGRLGEMLGCPWCLSVWMAVALIGLWFIPWGWLPVTALAVSRVANLANDVFHFVCRTPGTSNLEDP